MNRIVKNHRNVSTFCITLLMSLFAAFVDTEIFRLTGTNCMSINGS